MSVSEYIRTALLNPQVNLDGALAQTLANALCRYAMLVEQLSDQQLRQNFAHWEEELWQSIR